MSKGDHIPLRGFEEVDELIFSEDRAFVPLPTGIRVRAEVYDGDVRLTARNNHDMTYAQTEEIVAQENPEIRFPLIVEELKVALRGVDAVLDCQLVALDGGGYPNYYRFQSRSAPVNAYVTDMMEYDGDDLTQRPYVARDWMLRDNFDEQSHVRRAQIYDVSRLEDLVESAGELGFTQIVSKTVLSHYVERDGAENDYQILLVPEQPRQSTLL